MGMFPVKTYEKGSKECINIVDEDQREITQMWHITCRAMMWMQMKDMLIDDFEANKGINKPNP